MEMQPFFTKIAMIVKSNVHEIYPCGDIYIYYKQSLDIQIHTDKIWQGVCGVILVDIVFGTLEFPHISAPHMTGCGGRSYSYI